MLFAHWEIAVLSKSTTLSALGITQTLAIEWVLFTPAKSSLLTLAAKQPNLLQNLPAIQAQLTPHRLTQPQLTPQRAVTAIRLTI
jgi:aryl-alcohol dehydrogenase-like predicted oxidoreductase